MAEPLKNQYGAEIPEKIAADLAAVLPAFNRRAFLREALAGYDELELMARGRQIAHALRSHLPADVPEALGLLLASLGPKLERTEGNGLASFLYLPHTHFVATYGLGHFEESMAALHALTQRFTGEFAIRPFLEQHTALTLRRLEVWTADQSPHVRRLVSEGTRPRLPWASRLRAFQRDPSPVLALLERLKDDPELYVRRSVANNLNDIGKDHPALLAETARRWLVDAPADRRWLVQHALRSAVKRGEPGALAALGFGARVKVEVDRVAVSPRRVPPGGKVRVSCEVTLAGRKAQRVVIDLVVHYVKANGEARPKVFKLQSGELQPGEPLRLEKSLSLADFTTRKHYPGTHHLELLINGEARPLASFELLRGK